MKLALLLLLPALAMAAPDLQLRPSDVERNPQLQMPDPELRARALQLKPPESKWKWNKEDTTAEALFGLTMLGDYLQTRKITRKGMEMNPIMGPRGNRVSPHVYFPAAMALHVLGMRALPRPWRRLAQAASIGLEGGVVGRNLGLGINFDF